MSTRDLTPEEGALLDFLLAEPFPGRDELMAQAATVKTGGSSCGCGCPSFSLVPDHRLPAAETTGRVPAEAYGVDPAGYDVGILLFVEDGYFENVEVYSNDGSSRFGGLPDPQDLRR